MWSASGVTMNLYMRKLLRPIHDNRVNFFPSHIFRFQYIYIFKYIHTYVYFDVE